MPYKSLLAEVSACRICEPMLPMDARPVLQLHPNAKILIVGQAPGRKVHESGIPFDDASGNRLREWMGINKATFYDAQQIAILPMGFCYPVLGSRVIYPLEPNVLKPGERNYWHNCLTYK